MTSKLGPSVGQTWLAGALHGVAKVLGEVSSKIDRGGPVAALGKQAAERCGGFSHWLQDTDRAEVRAAAREAALRRPFIVVVAVLLGGVILKRLTSTR